MVINNLKQQNIVIKFLIINVAVFLLGTIFQLTDFLFALNGSLTNFLTHTFAIPASLKKLLFNFWTPFTYMFFHLGFWHLFFNMLWLYFMGLLFIYNINEKSFIGVYILGGLAGAFLFVLSYNLFPALSVIKENSVALGASAAISAIVIAIAVYQPDTEVFLFGIFKIKLFWIAIFFVIFDLFSIMGTNAGGHIAHLGGAAFGLIYALQLKKGKDITINFVNFFEGVFFKIFTKKSKFKVHVNLKTHDDKEYNYQKHQIREEIDRILDKIAKHGYKNLSKKEKDFLNKYKDSI